MTLCLHYNNIFNVWELIKIIERNNSPEPFCGCWVGCWFWVCWTTLTYDSTYNEGKYIFDENWRYFSFFQLQTTTNTTKETSNWLRRTERVRIVDRNIFWTRMWFESLSSLIIAIFSLFFLHVCFIYTAVIM